MEPPQYDDDKRRPSNVSSLGDEPPSYEAVVSDTNSEGHFPTFVLDGCNVYTPSSPSNLLYEVSHPPGNPPGIVHAFGVEKIRYRRVQQDGETVLKSRHDHIYDFKPNPKLSSTFTRTMILDPKASRKRVFHDVEMKQGLSPSSFTVEGHFKVERNVMNRLKQGNEIVWKGTDGSIIAIETVGERDKSGTLKNLPKLEVKVQLEEKVLDLLVTCWLVRVYKESVKETKQPLSWSECKCLFMCTESLSNYSLISLLQSRRLRQRRLVEAGGYIVELCSHHTYERTFLVTKLARKIEEDDGNKGPMSGLHRNGPPVSFDDARGFEFSMAPTCPFLLRFNESFTNHENETRAEIYRIFG